jgi:DNA-binding CsgD family transcriptional regulator
MVDLVLRECEQAALCALMSAEAVPGSPLPNRDVLRTVAKIIRADAIGVALGANGVLMAEVVDPACWSESHDSFVCDGPLNIGIVHWGGVPGYAPVLAAENLSDCATVGFRNGPDCVVQLWLDRAVGVFTERDLALLRLIAPILQRLLRERPTPHLPTTLTVQERRVLMHVATGRSNSEIAVQLSVEPSTVRKHLEHSYRKLGVTNRLAAVACLQGRDLPDLDLKERIERFA